MPLSQYLQSCIRVIFISCFHVITCYNFCGMRVVSIISQKGGAGKTTLALNLAGAAEVSGLQTVIVDLDPQASAKTWHDQRNGQNPIVISAHASRLPEVTNTSIKHGVDLCVIDTAPHSETAALAAARAADLVLIPCRPAVFDLRAIASSVDLAQIAKKACLDCYQRGSTARTARRPSSQSNSGLRSPHRRISYHPTHSLCSLTHGRKDRFRVRAPRCCCPRNHEPMHADM